MARFPFEISATDGAARTGVLKTPRGGNRTPGRGAGSAARRRARFQQMVRSDAHR